MQIEARVLGDLATNYIVLTAIAYQNLLMANIRSQIDKFEILIDDD